MLLVDETSLWRRQRYVTVLLNGETGEVLGMVKHRDIKDLSGFLAEQGRRWCRGIEMVVSDGAESYKTAIKVHLEYPTHVLDWFHVVRWFAAGLVGAPGSMAQPRPNTAWAAKRASIRASASARRSARRWARNRDRNTSGPNAGRTSPRGSRR